MNEIIELRRQGLSIRQIAAMSGFDAKTIRKYLADPSTPSYGPRPRQPSLLDPHKDYIDRRLKAGVWNVVVLLGELKQRGYTGAYTILRQYVQPKRKEASTVAVRRFETPAGHQAQVDWGELGRITFPDGSRKTLYGFVMTLGHSRAHFADVATDCKLPTFLAMHEAAFAALGGVCREILYDRMKTVVLGMDERGEIRWQPTFHDFAAYWGFIPRLCRAYRPQTKGKVESGIGYLRKNFLCGRTACHLEDLRHQLRVWTQEVAHKRVHGTTHRVVEEAWEEEKAHLLVVNGRPPYPLAQEEVRRVSRDAFVAWRSNRYSVPWPAAGREVLVREKGGSLEVLREGVILARHPLHLGRHQTIVQDGHHADMPQSAPKGGKARLELSVAAPEVEVRPLSVYAAAGEWEDVA